MCEVLAEVRSEESIMLLACGRCGHVFDRTCYFFRERDDMARFRKELQDLIWD